MKWSKELRARLTALVGAYHQGKVHVDWLDVASCLGCSQDAAQAQYRMLQWSPLRREAEHQYNRDRRIVERKLDVGTRTRGGRTPGSSAARRGT